MFANGVEPETPARRPGRRDRALRPLTRRVVMGRWLRRPPWMYARKRGGDLACAFRDRCACLRSRLPGDFVQRVPCPRCSRGWSDPCLSTSFRCRAWSANDSRLDRGVTGTVHGRSCDEAFAGDGRVAALTMPSHWSSWRRRAASQRGRPALGGDSSRDRELQVSQRRVREVPVARIDVERGSSRDGDSGSRNSCGQS